jgi:four helix bundle protein
MVSSYRELIVWQKAMALAEASYAIAGGLPDIERFGLASQMRRSAVSVASNIAEGHERGSRADYRRFIAMSCGSLAELETQLELSLPLYAIDISPAAALADETGRMLRAIERSLRTEPTAAVSQPPALSPRPS